MDNIIEIKNLKFKYPAGADGIEKEVLKGIDAEIKKGSFIAVIGSNGSGKSTMAKMLNALLLPTQGTVLVCGMDTKDMQLTGVIRQQIAMVFQNPDNQIVSSIVEDDVAFGPENLGVSPEQIRKRVDESLDSVRMGEYKKKSPHMLSGGQKQRIAIAGAVAMRPQCIVFDEPTAMLDPAGRKDVISIIKKLNKEGITTILITHFMEEAAGADRIMIIDRGLLRMQGSPAEIFSRKDELAQLGLDIPPAVKMADALRKKGIYIPEDVVDEEQLICAVMQQCTDDFKTGAE